MRQGAGCVGAAPLVRSELKLHASLIHFTAHRSSLLVYVFHSSTASAFPLREQATHR